jgi:hypothetical protein
MSNGPCHIVPLSLSRFCMQSIDHAPDPKTPFLTILLYSRCPARVISKTSNSSRRFCKTVLRASHAGRRLARRVRRSRAMVSPSSAAALRDRSPFMMNDVSNLSIPVRKLQNYRGMALLFCVLDVNSEGDKSGLLVAFLVLRIVILVNGIRRSIIKR